MLGRDGERLNPRKADLQAWRDGFARALRDRGVEAEATPRGARGVTRKAERGPVRRMRERYLAGRGPLPRVLEAAYRQALRDEARPAPWRSAIRERELQIRRALVAESLRLRRSGKGRSRTASSAGSSSGSSGRAAIRRPGRRRWSVSSATVPGMTGEGGIASVHKLFLGPVPRCFRPEAPFTTKFGC